jgi:hypothetical protein
MISTVLNTTKTAAIATQTGRRSGELRGRLGGRTRCAAYRRQLADQAPLPLSTMLGCDDLPYPPEMAESLLAPAKLAGSLGVEVTRLRVKSFHSIQAMLEVLAEQGAGLFVFGSDRTQIGRLRYRRAVRAIRSRATALVWLAE